MRDVKAWDAVNGERMQEPLERRWESGNDSYTVLQLLRTEDTRYERFSSMRQLERMGKTPQIDHYEVIYHAPLPAEARNISTAELLESLYQKFNLDRPEDFYGHSLSVSDVIVLRQDGRASAHYVDSIGFKELCGFLKQEKRPSVLAQLDEKKCSAPECSPNKCVKERDAHEL